MDGHWPDMAQRYLDRGLLHTVTGETLEAIAHYRKALAVDPDNALGHYLLGLSLIALGRRDEARSEWRKAAESRQDGPRAAWARWKADLLLAEEGDRLGCTHSTAP